MYADVSLCAVYLHHNTMEVNSILLVVLINVFLDIVPLILKKKRSIGFKQFTLALLIFFPKISPYENY